MNKKTLQQKLNQPYSTENWKEIVQVVFPNVQLFGSPQNIPVDNEKVESFSQLGNVRLNDGKNLALFELTLKPKVNILRNRVELNNLVSQYIDQEQTHGVLSLFEQGKDDYRFTFSAKAMDFDEEEGDFTPKRTDTKRYTYVLGKNESCRTPAERFFSLAENKGTANINTIQDAFSVEKLSKEFFNGYNERYLNFVQYITGKRPQKVNNKMEDQVVHVPNPMLQYIFNGDEKEVRDFVKLMLGRLVFIHFVQKKRWLGVPADKSGWENGDPNFLYNAFQQFEHKELFYSHFLEPLFHKALNNPERPGDVFEVTGTKVPYLNGGLFDKREVDVSNVNYPAEMFEDLLEFFNRFNFTIDESDLSEREVGIDPEMLGHIFENLLEDNKDKGAYYTPKEIVHYMCRESLKEYLKTQLEEQLLWPADETLATEMEQALDAFIRYKEAGQIIEFDKVLATALRDVKICDPAIGSGAFPMGLLNEIYHCMYTLYHASPDVVGDVWGMENWEPDTVKKNIIQNSIYGVDIEKGAVDIARLRFWLSLLIEEEEPSPLPNLDYKIVVGNSLVSKLGDEIIDIDWSLDETSHGLFGAELAKEKAELLRKISSKQKEFFDSESDKGKLASNIRSLKIDLLINQLTLMVTTKGIETKPMGKGKKMAKQTELYLQTLGWQKSIDKLKKLRESPDEPLHFFDWKLDFPEVLNELVNPNPGFDIVIGNPPYGAKTADDEKSFFKYKYKTARTVRGVQKGSLDSYTLFIELGHSLCKINSNLHYIVPLSITSSDSVTGVHKLLEESCSFIKVSSYAVRPEPVFEHAVVNTSIIFFKKDGLPNKRILATKMYRKKGTLNLKYLVDNLKFIDVSDVKLIGRYPKISLPVEKEIFKKIITQNIKIGDLILEKGKKIYYRTTGGRYFKVITNYPTGSTKERALVFSENLADSIGAILSSNLYFWFYQIISNNLDLKTYEIEAFGLPVERLNDSTTDSLTLVYSKYLNDIELNASVRQTTRYANIDTFREYKIGNSKNLIDQIDDIICPLYGLNEEEIAFIKNYEIQFRLHDDE